MNSSTSVLTALLMIGAIGAASPGVAQTRSGSPQPPRAVVAAPPCVAPPSAPGTRPSASSRPAAPAAGSSVDPRRPAGFVGDDVDFDPAAPPAGRFVGDDVDFDRATIAPRDGFVGDDVDFDRAGASARDCVPAAPNPPAGPRPRPR
jgi:hypothetical protein